MIIHLLLSLPSFDYLECFGCMITFFPAVVIRRIICFPFSFKYQDKAKNITYSFVSIFWDVAENQTDPNSHTTKYASYDN